MLCQLETINYFFYFYMTGKGYSYFFTNLEIGHYRETTEKKYSLNMTAILYKHSWQLGNVRIYPEVEMGTTTSITGWQDPQQTSVKRHEPCWNILVELSFCNAIKNKTKINKQKQPH